MPYTFSANGASNTKVSFFLLEIAFPGGTLRLTNADIDLRTVAGTYDAGAAPGAQTWKARTAGGGRYFSVESISAGIADTAGQEKIILDNADNYFSGVLFTGANPSGSVVKVYEALFDPASITTSMPSDVKLRLLRRISTLALQADPRKREAEISLDPYVVLQSLVMGRRHLGPKCTFVYKEPASCQATGSDTECDHTLVACSMPTKRSGAPANGNRDNFGGFTTITSTSV